MIYKLIFLKKECVKGDSKMEWCEPQNILSIIILITGTFSFLVWRATKNGAEANRNIYELNKKLSEINELNKQSLKREYLNQVIRNTQLIELAIADQLNTLNIDSMKKAPKHHGLSTEQLAIYFDEEEINIIENIWSKVKRYLEDYWMEENGEIKITFLEDERLNMIQASEHLKEFLFKEIQKLYRMYPQ